MNNYLDSIEQAAYLFPLVLLLIAIPYFYYQYKKYKDIQLTRSILTFTFVLYIICCYCLTLLPLPSYDEVAQMTGPFVDFTAFKFVTDFLEKSGITANPLTWVKSLESPWFYMPFFNFLMLIPFGIYLKRLFNMSLIKTTVLALLLSLSFELIQLSGLFGFYPKPYRLFQLDDLILNTSGAILGWLIAPKKVFTNNRIKNTGYAPPLKGRVYAFIVDIIILSLIIRLSSIIIGSQIILSGYLNQYIYYVVFGIIYFIALAWFLNGKTPGSMLFEYSYKTASGKNIPFANFLIRQLILVILVIPAPILSVITINSDMASIIKIPLAIIFLMFPIIVVIQLSLKLAPYYETFSNVFLTDDRRFRRINQLQRSSVSQSDRDLQ